MKRGLIKPFLISSLIALTSLFAMPNSVSQPRLVDLVVQANPSGLRTDMKITTHEQTNITVTGYDQNGDRYNLNGNLRGHTFPYGTLTYTGTTNGRAEFSFENHSAPGIKTDIPIRIIYQDHFSNATGFETITLRPDWRGVKPPPPNPRRIRYWRDV